MMNIYTNKFQTQQFNKVKSFFEQKNASFSSFQYAEWKAQFKNFSAILYSSGKLVIQGKDISLSVEEFENFMGLKTFSQNCLLSVNTPNEINFPEYIGTDESGKGDFFGPLVIAGVYVNEELSAQFKEAGIKDSKKLDDDKIIKLSAKIRNSAPHSVVVIMPEKYNQLYESFKNLNKLLAWGHARAIENVLNKQICDYAVSDKFGDEKLIQNALTGLGKNITLEQRTQGERFIGVAAASIIARAEFVKRCNELNLKYCLNFHKGVSQKVIDTAKDFASKYGKQNLNLVAKMHFKTIDSV